MRTIALLSLALFGWTLLAQAIEEVSFSSPGFPPTRMDANGRLHADWGVVEISLQGDSLKMTGAKVSGLKLDGIVPSAIAEMDYGPVLLSIAGFRAPAFPSGVDVITVRLKSRDETLRSVKLQLKLPDNVRVGGRTATMGGRLVMALPDIPDSDQQLREWGWADDAVGMGGWAKPEVPCDPAYRNIRAGMNGVPITYRFRVQPGAARKVVLGFCESHWAAAGVRPMICNVEGAPARDVDPIAEWGRHKPGAVEFAGRDSNGDGALDVSVLPKPGARDLNPILNVLWVFGADETLDLAKVLSGQTNRKAVHYIDAGGKNDQSLFAGGNLLYSVDVPSGGTEMMFLSGCAGGSVPRPEASSWTPERLRKAAVDVWREWPVTAGK